MTDIFSFWAGVPGKARVHPDDEDLLRNAKNSFERECLPSPFKGRLKTAPVVLLTLNPGYDADYDVAHANSTEGQDYYLRSRTGTCDLPSLEEQAGSAQWSAKIIRQFEMDYDDVRSKVAFLNIAPYKSRRFRDGHMLKSLASCRVALEWAKKVLFPAAKSNERVVVCLRSARKWGLKRGGQYPGSLFAPLTTPGAFIHRGPERERIVQVVQNACRS